MMSKKCKKNGKKGVRNEAIKILKQAVSKWGDYMVLHDYLSYVYLLNNDYIESMKSADILIKNKQNTSQLSRDFLQYSQMEIKKGNIDTGKMLAEKAIELDSI